MSENLVLLHGFGSTGRIWDGVLAHLPPERYSALALDLPGHGFYDGAPRPITFDGCVEHVLALSPDRFVLAGYSMGGRVALHVALAAPERVCRLVLVASTAGIEDPVEREARRSADRLLADRTEKGSIEELVGRWRGQAMFAGDPPEVDAAARREMARNRPGGVAAALRGIGTGEMQPLWDRLARLTMPATVLVGERDEKFRALGERLAQTLPDARLMVVSGGHVLPLENPQAVATALAPWQTTTAR
jgi:2-succinyl-6-hydroxy-2,4-cyclohexadiene-1-carboxylate synthase